jgi:hypothetical protein
MITRNSFISWSIRNRAFSNINSADSSNMILSQNSVEFVVNRHSFRQSAADCQHRCGNVSAYMRRGEATRENAWMRTQMRDKKK